MSLSNSFTSAHIICALVSFFVGYPTLIVPKDLAGRDHYVIRVGIDENTCLKCIHGVLSTTNAQLGALRSRVVIEIDTKSRRMKRQLQLVLGDSSIVKINVAATSPRHIDTAELFRNSDENPLARFKLPVEAHEILKFVDSIDAQSSRINIDTLLWQRSTPLKTFIRLNETAKVHVHDDGNTVSYALKDRALVITSDSAYVLPQASIGLNDSLMKYPRFPEYTTVLSPRWVQYHFITAESPLDTVIGGEVARLYRTYRHWQSDVKIGIKSSNAVKEVPLSLRTFDAWANSDSTARSIPASDAERPVAFRFDTLPFDIPAKYYPKTPGLCDATRDTIYCSTAKDGWIQVTNQGILHLPVPPSVGSQAEIMRCVSLGGCVLLTFDSDSDEVLSLLVSSIGVRLSPLLYHPRNVILAPIVIDNQFYIKAFHKSSTSLQQKIVWP